MRDKIMDALLICGPMKIGPLVYVTGLEREAVVAELTELLKERRVYFEEVDETFWHAEAS